ncbi:MAG: hypothetical protein ACRCS8_00145 [Brevinema sp.]
MSKKHKPTREEDRTYLYINYKFDGQGGRTLLGHSAEMEGDFAVGFYDLDPITFDVSCDLFFAGDSTAEDVFATTTEEAGNVLDQSLEFFNNIDKTELLKFVHKNDE